MIAPAPTETPFSYCECCLVATGAKDNRPPRLCENCQHDPLWAVPGEMVRNTKSGERAVVTGVGEAVECRLPDGSTTTWPLEDCERIERRWYADRL